MQYLSVTSLKVKSRLFKRFSFSNYEFGLLKNFVQMSEDFHIALILTECVAQQNLRARYLGVCKREEGDLPSLIGFGGPL